MTTDLNFLKSNPLTKKITKDPCFFYLKNIFNYDLHIY
jgi:hypothetical protein